MTIVHEDDGFYCMSVEVSAQAWRVEASPAKKLVLVALADHCDADGYCFPGVKSLARKTGLSRRSVQNALAWMRGEGFLVCMERRDEKGRQRSNEYQLLADQMGGAGGAPGGCRTCAPGGAGDAPLESSQEPPRGKSKTGGVFLSDLDYSKLPESLSDQVLSDYLLWRKKVLKRPIVTQTQVNRMAKELDRCIHGGWPADDALSEAMSAGWQGVKLEWLMNRAGVRNGGTNRQGTGAGQSVSDRAARREAELLAEIEANESQQGDDQAMDSDGSNLRDVVGTTIREP